MLSVTKYIFSQSYLENKCPPYLPKAQPCPCNQINCTIYDKPVELSKYNSLYAQDKGKKGIFLLPSSYFTILRTVFVAFSRIYPCLFFPSLWKYENEALEQSLYCACVQEMMRRREQDYSRDFFKFPFLCLLDTSFPITASDRIETIKIRYSMQKNLSTTCHYASFLSLKGWMPICNSELFSVPFLSISFHILFHGSPGNPIPPLPRLLRMEMSSCM